MATLYLILALVISIVAVIFALQNSMLVTISFFAWKISGSLSLVLLVTLFIGVLVGLLVLAPSLFRNTLMVSSQRKRINALETQQSEHKVPGTEHQKPVQSLISSPVENRHSPSPYDYSE